MMRVQRETGCYLGLFSNRYLPGQPELKERTSGAGKAFIRAGGIPVVQRPGILRSMVSGAGKWKAEAVLNHAVHQIDLPNWIMGSPRTVTAVLGNAA